MAEGRRIIQNSVDEKPKTIYERADDGLDFDDTAITSNTEIGGAMSEAESQFIDFVSKQVAKMDQKLLFDGNSSPPLPLIDRAIMQHEHVMLALTALYEQARWKWNSAKEAFNEWEAVKFLEVRKDVNKSTESAAKWYKKEEIDKMVIVRYRKEYAALKAQIQLAESKVSLFRRLIESWNQYAFQLGQLSRNGIAEKNSSDMTDKYEDQDDPASLAQQAISEMGNQ